MSQQIVSYRVGLIKKNYPELLQKNSEDFTKIQTTYKNTKNEVFVENSTNTLQTVQTVYKNTNDTKNENFVQEVVCKMPEPVEETGENSDWKTKFKFWFLQTFYKQNGFLQKLLQTVQTLYKNTNAYKNIDIVIDIDIDI